MRRILTIDGGGVRGIFALQVLARIEQLFRHARNRPDLVLADEFDMFAGTSTGAIIAAGLCWGMRVAEVESLYFQHGREMFTRVPWTQRWKYKYRSEMVAKLFQMTFHEDDEVNTPSLLGTAKLRKLMLIVMRNATTGSPWPVTNNPGAMYNDRSLSDCNLDIPLWQLLRASTAAPSFYAPEAIRLGEQEFLFIDGAITPYNNPALIALLTATMPSYRIEWEATPDSLLLVSVGTGGAAARLKKRLAQQVHLLDHAGHVPLGLISSVAKQQDLLCRILGRCLYGAPIDSEIGDLAMPSLLEAAQQKCSYVRYDTPLETLCKTDRKIGAMDNVKLMDILKELGRNYAQDAVSADHLCIDRNC